ncbi:mitochondrial ribosomal subunit protein-domain-containing protein [Bisporella sp. PMI_857]|nr:mitochondrial ribosomal subunit protein-domain-containing protein [Bisporella sp. PMI_857]
MSTLRQGLRLTARSFRRPRAVCQFTAKPIDRRRTFSTTICRRDEDKEEPEDKLEPWVQAAINNANRDSAGRRRAIERAMDDSFLEQKEEEEDGEDDVMYELSDLMGQWDEEFDKLSNPPQEGRRREKPLDTFLNMGEDVDEDGPMELEGEQEDGDEFDNMSVLAHGELAQHQELRHYARLAAWDLPMLSKLAKPFEPPTHDMPLRFRYTTYMGETHPAEKKVVVEFCIDDMPDLTKTQKSKFKKLAGVRYDPITDIVKMSCEMYESQAQNKRYLGDQVDQLLKEAKDPTDTFEDIPLDLRHHKFKPKAKWPKHWSLFADRRAELEQYRLETTQKDEQRMIEGTLVDGKAVIEQAYSRRKAQKLLEDAVPQMTMARGARAKQVGVKRT